MGFKFPIPPGYCEDPVWSGHGFRIGAETIHVLKYTSCDLGWNSDLTEFHETEADNGQHYIDRASREYACSTIKKNLPSDGIILEIGSSSGFLLQDMKKTFPETFVIGSDCIPEPLEKIARKHPDVPLIQFDLVNCPLPDNCVDVVVALNVLEHIEDDRAALKQLHRILKPGGHAILEVPANQDLYDFYDKQLKHFRRYSLNELSDKSERAGFVLKNASHLGFFVYPVFRFMKLRNKEKMKRINVQSVDSMKQMIHLGGPVMNTALYATMRFELILGKQIRYPRGIRCIITLKKD